MRNLLQILNEAAADNQAMINPVLSALRPNARKGANGIAVDLADEWRAKISEQWKNQIANAKTLRKADRITWYLRLSRMAIIQIYQAAFEPAKLNKLVSDYNSRCDLPFDQDSFGIATARQSDSINDLEHYLSLPIAGIQNYQFRFQSFRQVLDDFQAMEDKWKEEVKDTIEDNESEIIIDCGGGWFWVNTHKAYCDKESKAMGHCGNSPRQNSDDQLLSLRKKVMVGQDARWQPHLTFILASDGYLTEMKGKNNDKPVEKYHPMIVKLLKNPIIHGIRGGGYLPEHNFSMADLDETVRDELVEEKPELGTVLDLFNKLGASDEVFGRVSDELRAFGLEVEDWEGDTVTLESWKDLADFFRNGLYDNDSERLVMMADGDFDHWLDISDNKPEEKIEALIEAAHEDEGDVLATIADKVGMRPENAIKALVHMFPNSIAAIWDEVRADAAKLAKDAAEQKVTGFRLRCYDERMTIKDDGSVVITMPFQSLVYNIASYQEQDYDNTDGFEYCAQDGNWLAQEEDADEYYGDDNDAPTDSVDPDYVYEQAASMAIKHLLDLFHDDSQLDFGF